MQYVKVAFNFFAHLLHRNFLLRGLVCGFPRTIIPWKIYIWRTICHTSKYQSFACARAAEEDLKSRLFNLLQSCPTPILPTDIDTAIMWLPIHPWWMRKNAFLFGQNFLISKRTWERIDDWIRLKGFEYKSDSKAWWQICKALRYDSMLQTDLGYVRELVKMSDQFLEETYQNKDYNAKLLN